MGWDDFWVMQAELSASKSKDDSVKVGCVLVTRDNDFITFGYNGFPRGVDEVDRNGRLLSVRWHERPEKYKWVEHAERNAVYNAARMGKSTLGAVAYMNYNPYPCADCARALIQAGVVEVVGPDRRFPGKGEGIHYHIDTSLEMFREAGVRTRVLFDFCK